jgi:hypothetical protein
MNSNPQLEDRASSSRSKHEGESSFALCDRLSRTRVNSPRQLPTDQDYAVSTREYQTDQSSLKLPRLLLALSSKNPQRKQHRQKPLIAQVDTVTPYQANALIVTDDPICLTSCRKNRLLGRSTRRAGRDKAIPFTFTSFETSNAASS